MIDMIQCKLCKKEVEKLQKHHLIPQCVVKEIDKNNKEFNKFIIFVCDDCHQKIHNAFITHLVMTGKIKGFSKMRAIEYNLIKDFLFEKDPRIWEEYKGYKKEVLNEFFKELDNAL